jgi:hypothetical protein
MPFPPGKVYAGAASQHAYPAFVLAADDIISFLCYNLWVTRSEQPIKRGMRYAELSTALF